MKQIEIFDISSPCVGICQSGPKGYCLGCFRSREERLHWNQLEQDVKSKIVKACGLREKRSKAAKRKVAQDHTSTEQLDIFSTKPSNT